MARTAVRIQAASSRPAKEGSAADRRSEAIGAAVTLLARHGVHGLTHREVDRFLEWPIGSTSNYFRRRNDLLNAVGKHIFDLDLMDLAGPESDTFVDHGIDVDTVARRMAELIEYWLSPAHRERSMARAEILLETVRNAEVRAASEKQIAIGEEWFRQVFVKLGAPDPAASAKHFSPMMLSMLVALLVLSHRPSRAQLHELVLSWVLICSREVKQPAPPPAHRAARPSKLHVK